MRFQTAEEMLSHYQAIRNRLNPPKKPVNIAKREVVLPPPVPRGKDQTFKKFWELSTTLKNKYHITNCGILAHPYRGPDSPPTWREVMIFVQAKFDMSEAQICGNNRSAHYHEPRRSLWALGRDILGMSLPQIGRRSGDKDHTTVLHGLRKLGDAKRQELVNEFLEARNKRPRSW